MPYSGKPSRILDSREELDPSYQIALGVIADTTDWMARYDRIYGKSDFLVSTPDEIAKNIQDTTKDSIELWVSSIGGSLRAATQINELLQDAVNKGQNILVKNVSHAMSAATLPFVVLKSKRGGGTVTTETAPTAQFMIHAPRITPNSEAIPKGMTVERFRDWMQALEEIADWTEREIQNIAAIYAMNTALNEEQVRDYMEREYTFTAQETVDAGFISKIGSSSVFDGKDEPAESKKNQEDREVFYCMVAMADFETYKEQDETPATLAKAQTEAILADVSAQADPPPADPPPADPPAEPPASTTGKADPPADPTAKTDPPDPQKPTGNEPPANPPRQTQEAKKMTLTAAQEAEIRAKLQLDADVEITDEHVVKAWQMSEAEAAQATAAAEAKEQVRLRKEIEEGFKPYFDANIITNAQMTKHIETCMAADDAIAQMKSISEILNEAMPKDPPPADPPADPPPADPATQTLAGDPAAQQQQQQIEPIIVKLKNGEEVDVGPCEHYFQTFLKENSDPENPNDIYNYGLALRYVEKMVPDREVITAWQTRSRHKHNTSDSAEVDVSALSGINRHQRALSQRRILVNG